MLTVLVFIFQNSHNFFKINLCKKLVLVQGIENYMFEEHQLIKRAAVQCWTNLCVSEIQVNCPFGSQQFVSSQPYPYLLNKKKIFPIKKKFDDTASKKMKSNNRKNVRKLVPNNCNIY